jgi:hypothetical protein
MFKKNLVDKLLKKAVDVATTTIQQSQQTAKTKPQPTQTPTIQKPTQPQTTAPKTISSNTIEFGSYPQKADGSVAPIRWRILDDADGLLLLMSETIIEHRLWHGHTKNVPNTGRPEDIAASIVQWSECELRKFLNNEFFNQAFSSTEKAQIVERLNTGNGAYLHRDYVPQKMHKDNVNRLTDDTYDSYEERGCADTTDKVFLLNVEECIKYFPPSQPVTGTVWIWNESRRAFPTEHILRRGLVSDHPDYRNIKNLAMPTHSGWTWSGKDKLQLDFLRGGASYWLRNLGTNNDALVAKKSAYHNSMAAFVCDMGGIFAGGTMTIELGKGVRPVIQIRR